MISLLIKGLPSLQSGAFGHWRARRAHDAKWKRLVYEAVLESPDRPSKPFEKASIVYTRHSCGPEPDADNLRASTKSIQDGLIGIVIQDDRPEVIGVPTWHWRQCKRGEGFMEIQVMES